MTRATHEIVLIETQRSLTKVFIGIILYRILIDFVHLLSVQL